MGGPTPYGDGRCAQVYEGKGDRAVRMRRDGREEARRECAKKPWARVARILITVNNYY